MLKLLRYLIPLAVFAAVPATAEIHAVYDDKGKLVGYVDISEKAHREDMQEFACLPGDDRPWQECLLNPDDGDGGED